jgi:hypothetical protein
VEIKRTGKYFPWVVAFSAVAVAFSAAFFSVFGLSKLFGGAELSVIIMAGSLEFSKLVVATFLYKYWNSIVRGLRYYLLLGVFILVAITSAGIFGFLSNAYQGATIEFEKQSTVLLYKGEQLTQLQEDKAFLKQEINAAIAELPDNYITAKRNIRAEYNPKVLEINDEMLAIKQEIGELKTKIVDTGVDVGPAIYLARAFNTDIDTVVKFFILILIFVFDPLAVSLVIAANIAFEKAMENTNEPKEVASRKRKFWEVYKDKKDIPDFSAVEPDLPTDVEFEEINDTKRVDREKK